MKVLKVLNNSSAIVQDGNEEMIVMGNGLAFGKKPGDIVDEIKVEKSYVANQSFSNEKFKMIFEKISYHDSALAFDLIEYFKENLTYQLNDMIYLSLTDHISYAIQRAKEGIMLPNAVLHEVQMFYPQEYKLGLAAVAKVNASAGVSLDSDEAGFIALHIINSRWQESSDVKSQDISKIIDDLLVLLKETYKVNFSEDQINFHRLVTHLKYFLLREFDHGIIESNDFEYYDQVIREFPEAYRGADKISEYFATFLHRKIPKEEKVFLTIHINRFLNH